MTLPANNKSVGDVGHVDDHNAIVDEINIIKNTYLPTSASSNYLLISSSSNFLPVSASSGFLPTSASSNFLFVNTASAQYSQKNITIDTKTSDYNLIYEDSGKLIKLNSSSPIKIIIPTHSSVPFPIGTKIDILQEGSGQTSASAMEGVIIYSKGGLNLSGQWAAASLVKITTSSWVMIGSLS